MAYVSAPSLSLDTSRHFVGRTLSKPSAPLPARRQQPQQEAMSFGNTTPRLQAKPPTHLYGRQPIDSIFLDSPTDISYMAAKPTAAQPGFPPPKAMKILGYPGVVEDATPVKSSPSKKPPVLHRIQTSFSKSVPSSPVEDKFWVPQGKDATVKHGKKSNKVSKAELEANHKSALHKSNSKHFRPLPYANAVQINMFLDGGSEEDWLARSRRLDTNNGVKEKEIVGIRDENGQIWLDAEERTEFTSLIPKEGDDGKRSSYDPWVDFNDERLNSAASTGSSGSWVSSDRPIMELESAMNQMPSDFGLKRPAVTMPGAYLFPVDMGGFSHSDEDETIRFKAPRVVKCNGRKAPPAPLKLAPIASHSTVVLSSTNFHGHHKSQSLGSPIGFDDNFLRGITNDTRAAVSMEQLPTTKDRSMKRGVGPALRAMWGK